MISFNCSCILHETRALQNSGKCGEFSVGTYSSFEMQVVNSNTTTTTTAVFRPFVRDYPGELAPEGQTVLDFAEAGMMGWQWHQQNHMQAIYTSLQKNHTSTSSVRFLRARCPSWHPTNSVKALKAIGC